MKTPFKIYLAGAFIAAAAALTSCGNTKSNNASYAADSANKDQIRKTDSARNEAVAHADSGNKAMIAKGDSANKAVKDLKEDAAKFLVKAFESGMFEIELSQMAATHAASAEVKQLASHLVVAHKDMNAQMAKIAFDAAYKLPGGIDSDHAKDLNKLDKLKGADFDKQFMDMIVSGHEKSVDNYKKAGKELSMGETKNYVVKILPVIEEHLAMARKLKDRIK